MIVALAVCDYKYLNYYRFRAFAYTALDNLLHAVFYRDFFDPRRLLILSLQP